MPKIVIWMPRKENQAGHVAIATNEYYVSFWPANCLEKDGKNFRTIKQVVDFAIEVHKGCLVFQQDLDKEYEGDVDNKPRDPDCEHEIDAAKVSNEDLNAVIEEFLRYNEINPEDVTLARGDEEYQKYKELSALLTPEEAERIEDLPVKSLAKTKYSISAELVSSRKKDDDSAPFYKSHQSCVSFAFNLIQMAWFKCHPDQPIPIVNYEEAKSSSEFPKFYYMTVGASFFFFGIIPKEFAYKVPWFEKEVVRRYLITDELNNQPIISAQPRIDIAVSQIKSFYVSTFVLLLIGYFFPDTRYPNVFIFWNVIGEIEKTYEPLHLLNFILPLFIILLAHHSWCGVFLSVVIFQLGVSSYAIMKSRNRFWVELLSVFRIFCEKCYEHARVVLGREPQSLVECLRMYIDFLRRAHTK